jgi:hypothetical protein
MSPVFTLESMSLHKRFIKPVLIISSHFFFCVVFVLPASSIFQLGRYIVIPTKSFSLQCSRLFPHIYVIRHLSVFLLCIHEVSGSNTCPERVAILRL